jgi:hypothetical protein
LVSCRTFRGHVRFLRRSGGDRKIRTLIDKAGMRRIRLVVVAPSLAETLQFDAQ